jgi:hypothetical protein
MKQCIIEQLSAHKLRIPWAVVLLLGLAVLTGCGGSSEVMEISEAARKSVLQKKVDVQARPSKSSTPKKGQVVTRPAGS